MIAAAVIVTVVMAWMSVNMAIRAYVEGKMPQSRKPHMMQRVARTRLWLLFVLATVVLVGLLWLRAGDVSLTGIGLAVALVATLFLLPRLVLWWRDLRTDTSDG